MRLLRQRAVAVAVALVIGCHEVPEAPPELNVTLSATTAWSGGTVQLVSPGFLHLKNTPAVFVGPTSVPVATVNDSTLSITLPQATGTFDVWVAADGGRNYAGALRLTGFKDTYLGPVFSGTPYWLVPGGPPVLIGEGDKGAALFYLSSNGVAPIAPDSVHSPDCAESVGPTSQSGVWLFTGSRGVGACKTMAWSLSPTLQPVDSAGAQNPGYGSAWYVMTQPTPARWMFEWNNNTTFVDCAGGPCTYRFGHDPNGPNTVLLSPTGDRFIPLPQDEPPVVYDGATLDTAYTVGTVRNASAGVFSSGGDTLILAARDTAGHWLVTWHRSSDGSVLRSAALDALMPDSETIVTVEALALDPVSSALYVSVQA
ncbi:MAG TPA: hypothetical protein VJN62_13745, partial [Gemmatimonadales bacterium]|nr:hypothetical protein [Gemmatimonadales bacterium]